MKKHKKSNSNGITLIALVISIIVMLILAGVSINAVVGENGVLTRAIDATLLTSLATIEETKEFDSVENYIDDVDCYSKIVTENVNRYQIDNLTKNYIKESQQAIGNYAIDWSYVYYLDWNKAKLGKNINIGDMNNSQDRNHALIYDLKGKNIIYNKGVTYDGTKYYNYASLIGYTSEKEDESIILSQTELKKQKIFASLNDQTYVVKDDGTTYSVGKVDDSNMIGLNDFFDIQNELLKTEYNLQTGEQLCVGNGSTYKLKTDGTVWAVGDNGYGQLGNGTYESKNEFTKVNIDNVKQIPTDINFTMIFLKTDGTVWACGQNFVDYFEQDLWMIEEDGELSYATPRKVDGISNVERILCSTDREVAVLKTDGTVWMWGSDCFGQFGTGTVADNRKPTEITAITSILTTKNTKVVEFHAQFSSIVLLENGEVYTSGFGDYGNLASGNRSNRYTFDGPVLTDVTELNYRQHHTYAISNGKLYGWGSGAATKNSLNGTVQYITEPDEVEIENVIKVKGNIALTSEGDVYLLGLDKNNNFNRCLMHSTNIREIYHPFFNNGVLLLDDENVIWAFGSTSKAMLLDDYAYRIGLYKTSFNNVDKIYANNSSLIYKDKNNKYYGIGKNYHGELGFGHSSMVNNVTELQTSTAIAPFKRLVMSTGYSGNTYIIDANDDLYTGSTVYAYGMQTYFGGASFHKVPNPIGGKTYTNIFFGDSHVFITCGDTNLYGVGSNTAGYLATGTTYFGAGTWTQALNTVDETTINYDNAKQITERFGYTYVLMNDNKTIYNWGPNESGQLGLGRISNAEISPQAMSYFVDNNIAIKEIIPGENFVVFLTESNEIYTVGNNDFGQLGNGNTTRATTPLKVNIDNVEYVVIGNKNVIAVKNTGEIYSWGKNDYGQCGNKTLENLLVPTLATELMREI